MGHLAQAPTLSCHEHPPRPTSSQIRLNDPPRLSCGCPHQHLDPVLRKQDLRPCPGRVTAGTCPNHSHAQGGSYMLAPALAESFLNDASAGSMDS